LPEVIPHLGKKTDIWIAGVYQESRIKRGYDFFKDCKYILRLNAKHYKYTPRYIKPKTFAYNGFEEFNKLEKIICSQQGTPSSGISAIDFFVNYANTYKTLTLIGFDFFQMPSFYSPDNYRSPHNGNSEKSYVMKLKQSGRITIK